MSNLLKYGYDFFPEREKKANDSAVFLQIEDKYNIKIPSTYIDLWKSYDLSYLDYKQRYTGIISNFVRKKNGNIVAIPFEYFYKIDKIIELQAIQDYEAIESLKLLIIGWHDISSFFISCDEKTFGKIYALNWDWEEEYILVADTLHDFILSLRYLLPEELNLLSE